MTKGPLDGRLVVEIGARSGVATCGGLLAQLGATVVALEPRNPRSDAKWADRTSAVVGKWSICLDEGEGADRGLLERLTEAADILLLSTDVPGSFPGAGGASRWTGSRPATQIVCDITAFGHEGPLAGRPAGELEVQAVGGIMDITGRSDGPPLAVGIPVLETSTAMHGAASILAASRVQRLHGFGQKIDVSMFDAAVNALSSFLTVHFAGQKASRSGNSHALTSPWGLYPAKDGFVVICTVTSEQFQKVSDVIGQSWLPSDPRFRSVPERRKNSDALDAILSSWTASRTAAESIAAFSAVDVACGEIVEPGELHCEPNLRHRGMLRMVADPITGASREMPSSPLRSEPKLAQALDRVPLPDQDRERVIREVERRFRVVASGLPQADLDASTPPADVHPLAGIRIVEVGQYTLAPFATRQMSALGAQVVKVESPQGDALRRTSVDASGTSQIFAMMNTDKRGVVLDLRSENDRRALHQLLGQVDVLIENLKPGTLAGFGLTREILRERHPQLVYCSLSGFGADSAYPGRAALDTVVQAMSGLMSATKENGTPFKAGISAADLAGSQFGMLAMLAGVEVRDLNGVAPHFDIAMQDATVWLATVASHRSGWALAQRTIRCTDGYVLVEGAPESLRELGGEVNADRAACARSLEQAGLRAMPILGVAEVVVHPQTRARELLIRRATPAGEEHVVLNCPLRLCSTPARVERVMSALGADADAIAAEFNLGLNISSPSNSDSKELK